MFFRRCKRGHWSKARREEFVIEGNVREEGEGRSCCEDQVFDDKDADAPDEGFRERTGEKKGEEIWEVGWEEEEEIRRKNNAEGFPHVVSYNECTAP